MVSTTVMTFVLLLLCPCLCWQASAQSVYFVKPGWPPNVSCPTQPCFLLDDYVANSTDYFQNVFYTSFVFLNGLHYLSSSLRVQNFFDVQFQGDSLEQDGSPSAMICASPDDNREVFVTFRSGTELTIENLLFTKCSTHPTTLPSIRFAFGTMTNLTVRNIHFEEVVCSLFLGDFAGMANFVNLSFRNVESYTSGLVVFNLDRNIPPYPHISVQGLIIVDSPGFDAIIISGCPKGPVFISDSVISDCQLGMQVRSSCGVYDFVPSGAIVSLQSVVFDHNGAALAISPPVLYEQLVVETSVVLRNVTFKNNFEGSDVESNGVVGAYRASNITIIDCLFQDNTVSPIVASDSYLMFNGETAFLRNSGFQGGAIALYGSAQMWIPNPLTTHIHFENNTAVLTGGAIYVAQDLSLYFPYCFIRIGIFGDFTSQRVLLDFIGNVATDGGDAIYGVGFDQPCQYYTTNEYEIISLVFIILNISRFSRPNQMEGVTVIASDDFRVCPCNQSRPNCFGDTTATVAVYPGQQFSIMAALVGDLSGIVQGSIYASIQSTSNNETALLLDQLQSAQVTSVRSCTKLDYTIRAHPATVQLVLSPDPITSTSQISYDFSFVVESVVLPCPRGFSPQGPQGEPPECGCHPQLQSLNVTCDITNGVIFRVGRVWIGSRERNTSVLAEAGDDTNVAYGVHCRLGYCNPNIAAVAVSLSSIDESLECISNRSGVLCGRCEPPLSLALGSSRCLVGCTNSYLALLLVFAAFGVVLVLFIKVLNLTVTEGTLNGLLFYANIVGSNRPLFFPSNATFQFTDFLSVFIAWVNLDFGIETCFYQGLDAYARTWLQFVFPVYVWIIAALMIVVSHYSVRASRLLGNNAVHVLVTLILLSYSKLLRAVVDALSVDVIHHLDGSHVRVWSMDGSIEYLRGRHIPLFIFAVAVLLLLWLPFTFSLLTMQLLQRWSHVRVLCWVPKFTPFFDAYAGPLKTRHRYWVGLLLLVRCFLLLISSTTTTAKSFPFLITSSFTMTAIVVYLAAVGYIYKTIYRTVLELFYIGNLGILTSGTIYIVAENRNRGILVGISAGLALVQFIFIVTFHAYSVFKFPLKQLLRRSKKHEVKEALPSEESGHEIAQTVVTRSSVSMPSSTDKTAPIPLRTKHVQSFSHYRESFLAHISEETT